MSTNTENTIRNAIYKATLCLDKEDWNGWLDLCDEDFEYAIKAYSPEIRKDMCYLNGDRSAMASMTEMLPKHNTDHSPLSRHTVVYEINIDESDASAEAVYVDAGSSRLFLIGKYYDKFRINGDGVKFVERTVQLATRRLDKGSHYPL